MRPVECVNMNKVRERTLFIYNYSIYFRGMMEPDTCVPLNNRHYMCFLLYVSTCCLISAFTVSQLVF